jgi:hypothetical protein
VGRQLISESRENSDATWRRHQAVTYLLPNRRAKTMTKTKRFVVNENRNIIDTFNLAKSPKGYCRHGSPEDDFYLFVNWYFPKD